MKGKLIGCIGESIEGLFLFVVFGVGWEVVKGWDFIMGWGIFKFDKFKKEVCG